MDSSALKAAGEALYGARWQTDLARALDVSDRTVRRWVAGADDLPAGVAADLRRLCEGRRAALGAVIARMGVTPSTGKAEPPPTWQGERD